MFFSQFVTYFLNSVYVAFIHGFQQKLTYFMRTLPNFFNGLHKLDEAIDTKFTIDHAMSSTKGAYIHQRHNEMRDLLAKIATEVSSDVEVEPHLQELTGEQLPASSNTQDEARLDLSIRGFWQRGEWAFFDVRIFNPFAPSNCNQKILNVFKSNETEMKRKCARPVLEVEHVTFSPLVFTPYGGSRKETGCVISLLATRLSEKRNIGRSMVISWIQKSPLLTKISFALT